MLFYVMLCCVVLCCVVVLCCGVVWCGVVWCGVVCMYVCMYGMINRIFDEKLEKNHMIFLEFLPFFQSLDPEILQL